jgi:AcrR family transcriptional regulator
MEIPMSAAPNPTRRDERRETILDVAEACFLAEGYATTSMSCIASRVGGSKATLYNHFKSKEELFAAVVQRVCVEIQEALFEIEPETGDLEARLMHFARGFLRHLMAPRPRGIQRLVVAESKRFPELGQVFFQSGPKLVLERVALHLAELMEQGRLRPADTAIAAQQFTDLAMSGVYWPMMWGVLSELTPQAVERQAASAVDTFLRGYGRQP